jgi:hypothetical protein
MPPFEAVATAALGFVQGYIGIPIIFFSMRPILKAIGRVLKVDMDEAPVTSTLAALATLVFILTIEVVVITACVDQLSGGDAARTKELRRMIPAWIFIGLVTFIAAPRVETWIRRKR